VRIGPLYRLGGGAGSVHASEANEPLGAMRENLRAFYRILGERSPGGATVERAGVLAAIVPSCPHRSIVNAVVYESAQHLRDAHAELVAAYREAGVRAWTVWVPEADREAASSLAVAGHVCDARPRAMTLELERAPLSGAGAIDWGRTGDAGTLAALNEGAYGLPAGEFGEAMGALGGSAALLYLARVDGRPAACLAALDCGTDCGIYMVATAPAARGKGLASALVSQALLEARERGRQTSSLQATTAGYGVYRRLGYADVCALEMWELRTPRGAGW